MKSPRTLLSELEEGGCRLARLSGTRPGHLLLNDSPAANLTLARQIRTFAWPAEALKAAMLELAARIERRSFPGLIGIDSAGRFMNSAGKLISTPESIAAAQEFYNKK